MPEQRVKNFISEALERSVFLNPREPGLSFAELKEIGARAGLREGEIGDAFIASGVHSVGRGSNRLGPDRQIAQRVDEAFSRACCLVAGIGFEPMTFRL